MGLDPMISKPYKDRFIDDRSMSPNAQEFLQGIAAVLEDETSDWRPVLSELLELIPRDDHGERLARAGYAYGVGKRMRGAFPAPSILMFCSALNLIGHAPNVGLKESLIASMEKIDSAGLSDDEDMQAILQAAKERAGFDMVSQMLRNEFSAGLTRMGGYSREDLDRVVRDIVAIGHQARHEALVDNIEWSTVQVSDWMIMSISDIPKDQGFWEAMLLRAPAGHTFHGAGRLGTLAHQAQKGCAQAILMRLEALRK
jgi:hypothetical protein